MQIQDDTPTLYERIGGEENVRQLVHRFYHHMDTLPETQSIRWMHADNLQSAEEKLYLFLSGWMGGPSLYIEKYGHPRLRMRHLPFAIGKSARDQWMLCMKHALDEVVSEPALHDEIYRALYGVADFMRNKDEGGQ